MNDFNYVEAYNHLHRALPDDLNRLITLGYFDGAVNRINQLLKREIESGLKYRLIYELERLKRIRKDFSISEKEALEKIKETFPGISGDTVERWEENGWLEFIMINGEKYYYNRFLDNLLFMCLDDICKKKLEERNREEKTARRIKLLAEHVKSIKHGVEEGYVKPRRVKAGIKVKIRENAIEKGEKVRCWLPFPKHGDQTREVRLLRAYPNKYSIAPSDVEQRTIYFEFNYDPEFNNHCLVEFEYEITAYYKRVDPQMVRPYDENSPTYKEYTSEKPPHIVFTRTLKALADEIIDGEENPYLKAKKIYEWITTNVSYTYVREYSTYETIPEYVAKNLRGDCGFQALLFITLSRIAGIPSKWQSGWYADPALDSPGPHDWAMFYIEPYGWLFADLSFGGRWRRIDLDVYEFYFGGIDSYRTVFNSDIQGDFNPPKKFLRSDPVDNQRGEVETEDRNLYFNEFETKIYYVHS